MTILVIDDEEMIRSLAARILTRAGFDVVVAENGDRGLNLFSQHRAPINLILLDLNMRGMTGLETLREMRRINSTIPVIVCTGHALDMQDLPRDLVVNTCLLQKPYRSRALVARVRELTGHPESVR